MPFRKSISEIVGRDVALEVAFNPAPPEYKLTPILKNALDVSPLAKSNWEKLIPSRQKEIIRYFSSLKSEEAKERNLKNILEVLTGKKKRFMGRIWKSGS